MSGLLIAAPSSGAGKTTVTLGLLAALRRQGVALAPGKAGPDYIDPAFHAAASGRACVNYDPWAMRRTLLRDNAAVAQHGGATLVIEAMMGLFDGAADGSGSPADLAVMLGLPVVLVVDCARMSHSVAALVEGFNRHRSDAAIAGLILNRVASARHEAMLRSALKPAGVPVLGVLRGDPRLDLPDRHLGLVQAHEHAALGAFIADAADAVAADIDLDRLLTIAGGARMPAEGGGPAPLPPPGQRIAVARDVAFAFAYQHLLAGWRKRGADLSFFSPLMDEEPAADCDAIYLPGGYPELHAGCIAAAERFRAGMEAAIRRGAIVYGECGGYMVLGDGLVDADGKRHAMLGALPLVTSFARRERRLGYRRAVPATGFFWNATLTAHEFHYSTVVSEGPGEPLFTVSDAAGTALGSAGLRRGSVAGSFMHVIDRAEA